MLLIAGQPPEYAGFEGAPLSLMDRISTFLTAERFRLREDSLDWRQEAEFADGHALSTNAKGLLTSDKVYKVRV
jgi:hypothetical protein